MPPGHLNVAILIPSSLRNSGHEASLLTSPTREQRAEFPAPRSHLGRTCSSGSTSSQDPDPWVAPKSTFIHSTRRHHSNHTAIPENFSLIVHFPNYVFAERKTEDRTHTRPGVPLCAGGRQGRCRRARDRPGEGTHKYTSVRHVQLQPQRRSQGQLLLFLIHRKDKITPSPAPPKRRQKHPPFTHPLLKNKHSKKILSQYLQTHPLWATVSLLWRVG